MPTETQQPSLPAVVPEGPLSASQALPTLIMVIVAIGGGLASFYRKVKSGQARAFNVTELIGEIFVAGFAGLMAYWIFKGFAVNEYLSAAGVGIAGHMGSRALFLAEKIIEERIKPKGDKA